MPRSRATKKGGKRVLQKAPKTNQTEPGENTAEGSLGVSSSTSFRERLSNIFGKPSLSLRGKKNTGRESNSNSSSNKDGKDKKVQLSGLLTRAIKGLGRPFVGPLVGLPREEWQCAKCRATCHLAAGTGEGLLRRWFWQFLRALAGLTSRRRAATTTGMGPLEAKYQGLEFLMGEVIIKIGDRITKLGQCFQVRDRRKKQKKQERDRRKAERLELEKNYALTID